MSASVPVDARQLVDRGPPAQQTPLPLQVAGTHQLHVAAESSTAAQLAGVALSQFHYVPSTSATSSVNVVADAYDVSSSGSSTGGGASYSGGSLGVVLPALPSRRSREFIPDEKKDDEYWMKRQKNNEAAKRSREKRRANDAVMMRRIHELAAENKRLRLELDVLRRQLGMQPSTSESQPSSSAAAGGRTALEADDQRMLRHNVELSQSRYDDSKTVVVSSSSYRSTGALVSDQKPQPDEVYHHHHHHPHHAAYYSRLPTASEWPTTCANSDAFTTSSSDARTFGSLPRFGRSSSGNVLPSIGNLCGSAPLQDDDRDGRRVWASYRSQKDSDDPHRPASCQSPPPLPPSLVTSSPIVIFSDVSSSGDDSVDEALYGRRVDTLTVRRADERVADGARVRVESPLNLSTPSRHQSPEFVSRHAYHLDTLRRQSSVDFPAHWSPSESVAVRQRRSDEMLAVGRTSYVREEPRLSTNGSLDDAPREQSSRSTSLSSVASIAAWQTRDVPPPLTTDDLPLTADQLPTGGRHARCGLPLKVRRKFSSSTSRIIVEDARRQAYDIPPAVDQMLPEGPPSLMLASSTGPAREWYRSTSTERARAADMSRVLDRADEH